MPDVSRMSRMHLVLVALFFIALVLLSATKLEDTDAFTHLSYGRVIAEQAGLPDLEPFTYPSKDQPSSYFSWLFGCVFYLAYALLGSAGVALLKIMLVLAVFAVLLADSLRPSRRILLSLFVLTLVVLMVRHRFVERPDLVMMLFLPFSIFALNAYLAEGKRYLYWLPLTHLIWANAHVSVIFLFIPFGAVLAGGALQILLSRGRDVFLATPSWRQLRTVGVVFLLSLAATFVTPYGLDHYLVNFTFQQSSWWKDEINELRRPAWDSFPTLYLAAAALIAVIAADWISAYRSRRKGNPDRFHPISGLLMLLPFLYLGFSALRFVFIFAVVGGPLLVKHLSSLLDRSEGWRRQHRMVLPSAVTNVAFIAWLAVITSLTILDIKPFGNDGRTPGIGVNHDSLPEEALRYLDERGIQGNIFNEYGWGGYIAWRDYPRRKAFIDGRGYLPIDLLELYNNALLNPVKLDILSREYDFDVILTSVPQMDREVAAAYADRDAAVSSPDWAMVYWDDRSMVYLKRGGRHAEVIAGDEYRVLKPATMLANVDLLAHSGNEDALVQELQRTIERSGARKALYLLGALQNSRGRFAEAIRTFEDPRLLADRDETVLRNVYNGLGFAHFSLGKMRDAIRYYRRSLRIVEDADICYNIGAAYLYAADSDPARAVKYFERAVELRPGHVQAARNLATAYRRMGKDGKAAEAERLLQASLANDAGKEHFQLAVNAYIEKRYADAIREFNLSLEANPFNPVAYGNLGFLYYDLHDLDQSLLYQQKALASDPRYANAHYGLALVYKARGDSRNAGTHWREYLRIEPSGFYARKAKEELSKLDGK